jgi:S-adenosylmethionine-diacylglycerol 3-amino-3-carboxypropyl transferase
MTEVASHAAFDRIRYAQLWEDADVLVAAMRPEPGQTFVSIASAGDNALALLTLDAAKVVAVDLNATQIRCARLRCAALRHLSHAEFLELLGSRPSGNRRALLKRCEPSLTADDIAFWQTQQVERGVAALGKFEDYFGLFRNKVLPWVHSKRRVAELLRGGSITERHRFFDERWNTWRWRLLFRVFFSRFVMGRFGRDPAFFRYVEGDVATRIFERAKHALTELNPAENPYLTWILTGTHGAALPLAWRPEHFATLGARADRIDWRQQTLEETLDSLPPGSVHGFNLSDIFEYMSAEAHEAVLRRILRVAAPGARLVYWNMLVPRKRPESLADRLRPLDELAKQLHLRDKAFFYQRLVIEEVVA